MSLLVLDDQLSRRQVFLPLQACFKTSYLRDLRPDEQILDERVPAVLLQVKQPTFITIDQGFWDKKLCHPGYGIFCFALADDEQH